MRGTVAKRLRRIAYAYAAKRGRPEFARRFYRQLKRAHQRRTA